jgi:hypothetical protein
MLQTPIKEVEVMPFNNEEITEIERIFDARYVRQKDCDRTVEKEDGRITKLEIRLENVNTKLGILIAILSAIGVPVVSLCIKLLFGG